MKTNLMEHLLSKEFIEHNDGYDVCQDMTFRILYLWFRSKLPQHLVYKILLRPDQGPLYVQMPRSIYKAWEYKNKIFFIRTEIDRISHVHHQEDCKFCEPYIQHADFIKRSMRALKIREKLCLDN